MVGPADERGPVGCGHDFEVDGREQGRRQPGGEQRDGGGVLHLAASADHGTGRAAEQDGGIEQTADGGGDVLEGPDVVGRDEQHDEIRPLVTEPVEHLADGLTDGLRRDGMFRQPERVHRTHGPELRCSDTATGRRPGASSRCPRSRACAARPATGPARSTSWPGGRTRRWLPRSGPAPTPSRPG